MLGADIVLSIGFTSPGLDALLIGKKSIYYSELYGAGQAFKRIDNFVFESSKSLELYFNEVICSLGQRRETFVRKHKIYDSFNDGRALERLINYVHKTLK